VDQSVAEIFFFVRKCVIWGSKAPALFWLRRTLVFVLVWSREISPARIKAGAPCGPCCVHCPSSRIQFFRLTAAQSASRARSPLGESSIPGKFRAACELGWKLHHQNIYSTVQSWKSLANYCLGYPNCKLSCRRAYLASVLGHLEWRCTIVEGLCFNFKCFVSVHNESLREQPLDQPTSQSLAVEYGSLRARSPTLWTGRLENLCSVSRCHAQSRR